MAKSKAGSSASRAAAAAADESGHSFGPGDIVMAKVKGYPAWPGVICDEKNVPSKVRAQKTIKSAFTVRFFPHADYNWFKARDMTLLTQREIRAYLDDPHKKQADLRQAYKVALDPHAWVREQDEIVAAAERAAEDEEEGVDELDGEEADEDDARPAKSGKRKRASEDKGGKVRESADTKAKKKKKLEAAEPKKSAVKASEERGTSAAARKTEDEADGQDPEMKRVYGWRHALQRGFLPKDGKIKEEDMPTHDKTFSAVEAHKSMTEEQLKETKIGKVMKRIAGLSDVPRDAEFDFTGRALALCNKWGEVMAGAAAPGGAAARATSAKDESNNSSSSKHDSSEAAASSSDAKEAPSQDASKPAAAATNGSAAAPSSSGDAPDASAPPADAAPAAAEASANGDAPSSEAAAAAPSNGDAAPASVGQDD